LGSAVTVVEELENVKDGVPIRTVEDGTRIATHLLRVMGSSRKCEPGVRLS
jgi:hypothetical protein